jgi:hypothetical protein
MASEPRKLSEMMKEMAESLLRNPGRPASVEATVVALMFANIAWNETVALIQDRQSYRSVWAKVEAEKPELWSELKSNDVDALIDELVEIKKRHYPDDQRRILACGMVDGKVRVEWLPPAAPRRRLAMGDGVAWPGENGQTRRGHSIPAGVSWDVTS